MPFFGYARWFFWSRFARLPATTTYGLAAAFSDDEVERMRRHKEAAEAEPLPTFGKEGGEAEAPALTRMEGVEVTPEGEATPASAELVEPEGQASASLRREFDEFGTVAGDDWTAIQVLLDAADAAFPALGVGGLDDTASIVASIGKDDTKTESVAEEDVGTVDVGVQTDTGAAVLGAADVEVQTGSVVGAEGEMEEEAVSVAVSVAGDEVKEEEVKERPGKFVARGGVEWWRRVVVRLEGLVAKGEADLAAKPKKPRTKEARAELAGLRKEVDGFKGLLAVAGRIVESPGPRNEWVDAPEEVDEEEDAESTATGTSDSDSHLTDVKPLTHADLFARFFDDLFPHVEDHQPGQPFIVPPTVPDATRRLFGNLGTDVAPFGAYAGFLLRAADLGELSDRLLDTGLFLLANLKERADLYVEKGAPFSTSARCLVTAAALVLADQLVEPEPRELSEWVELTNLPTHGLHYATRFLRASLGESIVAAASANANPCATAFERRVNSYLLERGWDLVTPFSVGGALSKGDVGPKRKYAGAQGMRLFNAKQHCREDWTSVGKTIQPASKLAHLPFFAPPGFEHVRPLPTAESVFLHADFLGRHLTNEWAKTLPVPAAGILSRTRREPYIPAGYGWQILTPDFVRALGVPLEDEVGTPSSWSVAPAAH